MKQQIGIGSKLNKVGITDYWYPQKSCDDPRNAVKLSFKILLKFGLSTHTLTLELLL